MNPFSQLVSDNFLVFLIRNFFRYLSSLNAQEMANYAFDQMESMFFMIFKFSFGVQFAIIDFLKYFIVDHSVVNRST